MLPLQLTDLCQGVFFRQSKEKGLLIPSQTRQSFDRLRNEMTQRAFGAGLAGADFSHQIRMSSTALRQEKMFRQQFGLDLSRKAMDVTDK